MAAGRVETGTRPLAKWGRGRGDGGDRGRGQGSPRGVETEPPCAVLAAESSPQFLFLLSSLCLWQQRRAARQAHGTASCLKSF